MWQKHVPNNNSTDLVVVVWRFISVGDVLRAGAHV